MELNNRIRALNKYAENEHATALAQLRFVDTFVLPHAADTTIRHRRDVRQSPIVYRANDDYTTTTTAAHTKRHTVKGGVKHSNNHSPNIITYHLQYISPLYDGRNATVIL